MRPEKAYPLIAVALLSFCLPGSSADKWKLKDWEYRKTVKIIPESLKTPLRYALQGGLAADFSLAVDKEKTEPDIDAAVIRLVVDGHCKPDGSDVRLLNERGREVPYILKEARPDMHLFLLFKVENPKEKFTAYYGNPKASKPKYAWECRRGLFLETRPCPPGLPRSFGQMKTMLAKATKSYGVQYNMWIFNHYNPMGPVDRYLTIYDGWLDFPETGTYTLGTTSDGPSFFLVDGKIVAQKLDAKPANREVFNTAKLEMTKGVHRVQYYAGGMDSTYRAVAAWQPPSAKRSEVIRYEYYPKVLSAKTSRPERRGSPFALDFDARIVNSIPIQGEPVTDYRFTNKAAKRSRRTRLKYTWDFGDGTTSKEESPEHVYFTVGDFKVTLTARDSKGHEEKIERTVKVEDFNTVSHERQHIIDALQTGAIHLEHHHSKAFLEVPPTEVERIGKSYVEITRKYSLEKAAPATLLGILRLCYRMKDNDRLAEAGESFLKRFSGMMPDIEAEVCLKVGDIYLNEQHLLEDARRIYQRATALGQKTEPEFLKIAYLRLGSIHLTLGDAKAARAAYDKAEGLRTRRVRWQIEQLKIGSFEISVVAAMNEEKYASARETLDDWEREFPRDVLRGRTMFLRAKSFYLEKDYERAATEFKRSITANESVPWITEAYTLNANSLLALKRNDEAYESLACLLKTYPKSKYASEARKLYKKHRSKFKGKPRLDR